MVIGKAYKENSILVIFLYFFLLIVFVSWIVSSSIFINEMIAKILLISVLSILIILLSYLPIYVYRCKKTPDAIIIYNPLEETITINGYKKNYIVNIADIVAITVHTIATKILLANRVEDGKLFFYLSDGTKIKTVDIDNLYDTYYKLDEIIFVDRENDAEIKDQLIDRLDGWGSKKEYPSIVSVLVAFFIPFFGLFFVSNQKEFKELKNGKATGRMAVALVISALWVLAIILFIAFA